MAPLRGRASLPPIFRPAHGVRTAAVAFARAGARFTRDFDDLVGWAGDGMDKNGAVPAHADRLGLGRVASSSA